MLTHVPSALEHDEYEWKNIFRESEFESVNVNGADRLIFIQCVL